MKIGPVDHEIALLNLKKKLTQAKYIARSAGLPSGLNKPCQLQSYWTEFHEILTRFRGIIYTVNTHIDVAIAHYVLE